MIFLFYIFFLTYINFHKGFNARSIGEEENWDIDVYCIQISYFSSKRFVPESTIAGKHHQNDQKIEHEVKRNHRLTAYKCGFTKYKKFLSMQYSTIGLQKYHYQYFNAQSFSLVRPHFSMKFQSKTVGEISLQIWLKGFSLYTWGNWELQSVIIAIQQYKGLQAL